MGPEKDYLIDWALAACIAGNKSTAAKVSQVSYALLDIDVTEESFEDWMEFRLDHTLGVRRPTGAALGTGGVSGSGNGEGSHPIVINMPTPPPHLTIDEIDMVYHRGVEANKRANETIITTGTKYSEN